MTLNIANIDKLISSLERRPHYLFSMARVAEETECGTVCCIKGDAEILSGYRGVDGECLWGGGLDGYEYLGLDEKQGWALFAPNGFDEHPERFPLSRALDVLRHLRATGRVDWRRFPASAYRQPPAAPKLTCSPPVVIDIPQALPESLTGLLRQPVEASHAS